MYISNTKYENFDFDNPPKDSIPGPNWAGLPVRTRKIYKIKEGYFFYHWSERPQVSYVYIEPDEIKIFEEALKSQYVICGNIYYARSNRVLEEIHYQIIDKYIQEARNYFKNKFGNGGAFIIYKNEVLEIRRIHDSSIGIKYNPINLQIEDIHGRRIEISLNDPLKFFRSKNDALEFLNAKEK